MTSHEQRAYDALAMKLTEAGYAYEDTSWDNDATASISITCTRLVGEEVQEFVENPCPEEVADIREILDFICERLSFRETTIQAAQASKHAQTGRPRAAQASKYDHTGRPRAAQASKYDEGRPSFKI